MNGGDAQVGSDVMLRNPLYELRLFLQQVEIALPGRVFYKRKKMLHILERAFKHSIDKQGPHQADILYFFQYPVEVFFVYPPYSARLDGFDGDGAWHPLPEAFHGSYRIAFEEKLECNVFPVIVKPDADTTLFNDKKLL